LDLCPLPSGADKPMNYLAHLILAGPHPDHRLGALLGDHLKGLQVLDTLRPELRRGVLLHRRIDGWSDRHAVVTAFTSKLNVPWRRYAGIMLDVLFDHLLSQQWTDYSDQPLSEFAADTERLLADHRHELPDRLRRFTRWAEQASLWTRMHDRQMIQTIFDLIALRHGQASPLKQGLDFFDQYPDQIQHAFDHLMPDLMKQARTFRSIGPST